MWGCFPQLDNRTNYWDWSKLECSSWGFLLQIQQSKQGSFLNLKGYVHGGTCSDFNSDLHVRGQVKKLTGQWNETLTVPAGWSLKNLGGQCEDATRGAIRVGEETSNWYLSELSKSLRPTVFLIRVCRICCNWRTIAMSKQLWGSRK